MDGERAAAVVPKACQKPQARRLGLCSLVGSRAGPLLTGSGVGTLAAAPAGGILGWMGIPATQIRGT